MQLTELDTSFWTCEEVFNLAAGDTKIIIAHEATERVAACRRFLEDKLAEPGGVYYGINTGFGALCNTVIDDEDLAQLQLNLVRSHACGVGEYVPVEVTKIILLLKIKSLIFGHSGIDTSTLARLVEHFNLDLLPKIHVFGSLGASGDLAPLAHLSLPLVGEGEVIHRGQTVAGKDLDTLFGLQPLALKSKEGLALLNGTQFMAGYGVWLVAKSERLLSIANRIAALSCDAFLVDDQPFHPLIHQIRPHTGQQLVAETIAELRKGEIKRPIGSKKTVQDPYSFRCIPQVHGGTYQVIEHLREVFETEINSVTDNPNIFVEEGLILNGGNFHGQPLALALDYLAIGLAELGSISERRIFQLLSGERGLPPFLAQNPGLESGAMIAQYTAASIVSANKQFCTPSSVDSITSSNGQEDHVSMGANAAVKAMNVYTNVVSVLAIELLVARLASSFRDGNHLAPAQLRLLAEINKTTEMPTGDHVWADIIQKAEKFILSQDMEA